MEITLCVLADYANVSRESKLNIMGIFSVLHARRFPVLHPRMQLVIEFQADSAEAGRDRKIEVQLRDADGRQLFALTGQGQLQSGPPGEVIRGHHILGMNNLKFDRPGSYEFLVLLDNDVRAKVPFKVVQLPPPAPGTGT